MAKALSFTSVSLPAKSKGLKRAARIIQGGGLVAFPTETVYGLGADATNPKAVAKIFEVKARPRSVPLIVHVSSVGQALNLWRFCPKSARRLIKEFWPGPLTIVLPKKRTVSDLVTGELPTVGIRMPNHPVAQKLIRLSGCPIAAPSANRFGRPSPTTAKAVYKELGDSVDLILDGGPTKIGIASTVVTFQGNKLFMLRQGGIPLEDIQRVVDSCIGSLSFEKMTR